ncbi:MAG: ATP-binding cassette domain-containing protein, partial [Rhodobacteraceae bacterium]|nr:ATP-binding cassette domain-containing protein [Paracoccaceae bacterium]
MLEIRNVTVRFGGVIALNDVSASFGRAVSGIIGPNGAGKTTLMNVLSGFVGTQSGSVTRDGQDLLRLAPHRRAHWGLRRSFQKEEIADDLTVYENVLVQIDHARAVSGSKQAEVETMLELVGMASRAGKLGADLSGFERRLTDVAKCLVGKPRVVMFDEPAGGMSVDETRQLGVLIQQIHGATGAQV